MVAARQLRLRPDRLPAARRTARLDRRRPGVRLDGLAPRSTRRRSGRAGCATSRSTRTDELGVSTRRARRRARRRASVRARRLGGRRDDRAVGRLRGVRRRRHPRAQLASMRAMGRLADARRGTPTGSCRVDPVRRLARSRRPVRTGPGRRRPTADFLANAFFVHSARLTADAARGARRSRTSPRTYERLADRVARRPGRAGRDHALTTQTGCAVALEFGIAPAATGQRSATRWPALVVEADGRVATGFLGTPLVLPALAAAGHFDEAYLMLLRREVPSWLYQVVAGATTVWERWDAIRPDGSIHDGRMTALPGMERRRPGRRTCCRSTTTPTAQSSTGCTDMSPGSPPAAPGYRSFRVAPRPVVGMRSAEASIATPFGSASVSWTLESDSLRVELDIPVGTRAVLDLPAGPRSVVTCDGRSVGTTLIEAGQHELLVTHPLIVAPGDAAVTEHSEPARAS